MSETMIAAIAARKELHEHHMAGLVTEADIAFTKYVKLTDRMYDESPTTYSDDMKLVNAI